MSNTYIYQGAVLVIGGYDVSDDTVTITYSGEKTAPSQATYGPNSPRVPKPGKAIYTGEIQVIYDYATSATTASRLLLAEWTTPTDGGLGIIFKRTGEGSGEEEITIYIQLTKQGPIGGKAEEIQTDTYSFNIVGQPSSAAQTT